MIDFIKDAVEGAGNTGVNMMHLSTMGTHLITNVVTQITHSFINAEAIFLIWKKEKSKRQQYHDCLRN